MENKKNILVPADVPKNNQALFIKNYNAITRETGRLFLFSCDHKIEHLNNDFYGPAINLQALHPEHLFRIATNGDVGAMATHLGLLARYGNHYQNCNYIIKLNGTTHLADPHMHDPFSALLCSVDDVVTFKNNSGLSIAGIGITIYLGNEYESEHLSQAAHAINHAHSQGLVTIAWIYFRGKSITQENDPHLIAGAAGIAVSLGADFVKVKPPLGNAITKSAQALKIASAAAGNTKLICSGGEKVDIPTYLEELYCQIHVGDSAGTATGRNIFQLPLPESIALTHAISAIVYKNADYKSALSLYHEMLARKG